MYIDNGHSLTLHTTRRSLKLRVTFGTEDRCERYEYREPKSAHISPMKWLTLLFRAIRQAKSRIAGYSFFNSSG
jgi:hypothetical protein